MITSSVCKFSIQEKKNIFIVITPPKDNLIMPLAYNSNYLLIT